MKIAIYARVSTGRQAENDLSIPDQLRQMRQWAGHNGHTVVKEYIDWNCVSQRIEYLRRTVANIV